MTGLALNKKLFLGVILSGILCQISFYMTTISTFQLQQQFTIVIQQFLSTDNRNARKEKHFIYFFPTRKPNAHWRLLTIEGTRPLIVFPVFLTNDMNATSDNVMLSYVYQYISNKYCIMHSRLSFKDLFTEFSYIRGWLLSELKWNFRQENHETILFCLACLGIALRRVPL